MVIQTEHKSPKPPELITLGVRVRGNDPKTVQVNTVTKVYYYNAKGDPVMGSMEEYRAGQLVHVENIHRYERKNQNLVFTRYTTKGQGKDRVATDSPTKFIRVSAGVAEAILANHSKELDIRESTNEREYAQADDGEVVETPEAAVSANDFVAAVEPSDGEGNKPEPDDDDDDEGEEGEDPED